MSEFKNQVGILADKKIGAKELKKSTSEIGLQVQGGLNSTKYSNDNVFTKLDVLETMDYSKFHLLPENRTIKPSLVARIISSMQEELLFDYIQVTTDFGIIDGQHRAKAREYLGLPIYYVIVENYNVRTIIGKNTHAAWKEYDFINCYAKMGDDNYQKIISLKEQYPDFKHTRLYVTLALNKYYNGQTNKNESTIKDGTFKINNWDMTIETCEKLMDFAFLKAQRNKAWGQHQFFIALLKIFSLGDKYDHEWMQKRLQLLGNSLTRNINVNAYLRNLSNIYNSGIRKEKAIHFDLEC